MSEILPVLLKVILVWFIAATDPETATLWMTDPFVTACVRSSVFAAGAFARDTKTAPPAIIPTRATLRRLAIEPKKTIQDSAAADAPTPITARPLKRTRSCDRQPPSDARYVPTTWSRARTSAAEVARSVRR